MSKNKVVIYRGRNADNSATTRIVFEYEFKELGLKKRWDNHKKQMPITEFTYGFMVYENGRESAWYRGNDSLKHDVSADFFNKIKDANDLMLSWHLNGMNAGTKDQMQAIKDLETNNTDWYDQACRYLKGLNGHEDNGYKFGHGWLARPMFKRDRAKLEKAIQHVIDNAYLPDPARPLVFK